MFPDIPTDELLNFSKGTLGETNRPEPIGDGPCEERNYSILKDVPLSRGQQPNSQRPHFELPGNREIPSSQQGLRRTSFSPHHPQYQVKQAVMHVLLVQRQERLHNSFLIFIKKAKIPLGVPIFVLVGAQP